ncbi:hypothetical protein M885DRAFT_586701 [Pelagophyceae sp. CCMP2097]|nr:hypothetical protein M885DRAFT_586701 [Pelagophyceae sp. CCMP2097]
MAPYVGKRVKVDGLSRADLNGKRGVALSWDDDKGRYNVKLDDGSVIALKPGNVLEIPEGEAQSPMDMFEDYKGQALGYLKKAEAMLPPGVQAKEAAFVFLAFLFLCRQAGVVRALAIAAFAGIVVLQSVPAFKAAGGGKAGAKAGVEAAGAFVAQTIHKATGRELSQKQALGAFLVAMLAAAIVGSLMHSTSAAAQNFSSYAPPTGDFGEAAPAGDGYSLGFEDARAGRPFGTSLNAAFTEGAPRASSPHAAAPSGGLASKMNMGSLMSLGMLGKTIYDLGGQPWDAQAAVRNAQAMPMSRKAITALLLARLLGLSPI